MIEDTCTCGADFRAEHKLFTNEITSHREWLKEHAMCRSTYAKAFTIKHKPILWSKETDDV